MFELLLAYYLMPEEKKNGGQLQLVGMEATPSSNVRCAKCGT